MSWRIVRWCAETRRGEIASEHFDPVPFSEEAVPPGVSFTLDEEVAVEFDGPSEWTVTAIQPVRFRADERPAGSEDETFAWVNARRFIDLIVDESSSPERFALWVGSCCQWCSDAARVNFENTQFVRGFGEDNEFDDPYFRRATEDEIGDAVLLPGQKAYFVVCTEYDLDVNAGFLVIAEAVTVERLPCTNAT